MINISEKLMLAMVKKKNAVTNHDDTTEIDWELNALKDFKTRKIEFETSGSGKKYDDLAELEILKRLIKQRQVAQKEYLEAGRQDLAYKEGYESEVLEKLLPELPNSEKMEEAYLEWRKNLVSDIEFPNISKREMGLAIKSVSEKFALIDKGLLSQVVRKYIKG